MSEQAKDAPEEIKYETMPGADAVEAQEGDDLDMNFAFGEEAEETEAEVEETEAEVEETEAEAEVEETEEDVSHETEEAKETEEVEAKEAEPEKKETKSPMIPKSRLDEVLAQNKALKKRIAQTEEAEKAAEETPDAYDFDAKEEAYMDAVLDGDKDKAKAIRKEIRQAQRTQLETELTKDIESKVTRSSTETAIRDAASAIEEAFPIFDASSDQFNKELTDEVNKYMTGFISSGQNPVEALEEATTYVLQKNNMLDSSTGAEVPVLGQAKEQKKRSEVSKKLKAADAQPPELPGESSAAKGEKALDIHNMTPEEFDALPDATLKRLRGDVL
tara:strand:+ start:27 stop:1022 length:996 start_codon:yes stop_codon:yes gene_type:complete